jgi:ATP:ADP antiporter, AAA family
MASSHAQPGSVMTAAVVCAGAVSAQFIAGKATRDALYLAHLDVTTLPAMVMAAAGFSLLLVGLSSSLLRRVPPATVIPWAFVVSAVLLLVQWGLLSVAPAVAAQLVYLQISGLGPMLGSGFWLIATERFDPRTARRHFARIAGIGTLSGLGAALVAERVAVLAGLGAMLPLLAMLNLVCAWQVARLARAGEPAERPVPAAHPDLLAESPRSGVRVLAGTPYLRALAALVLFGTIGAALVDYLFKVQAVATFGRGEALLQFFALYYAGISLLSFLVQTTAGSYALEKLGLTATTSTPSMALVLGSVGAWVFPGLGGILALRGGEAVFRGSLFRTGYEIFYTPVPPAEKRAAKSLIDVGFDRLGDAVGGGLVRLILLLPAAVHASAILGATVVCAVAALVVSRWLTRGYIQTLERSLLHRAVELDLAEVEDVTTRTVVLKTLRGGRTAGPGLPRRSLPVAPAPPDLPFSDPEVLEILALRSRDRERVRAVLRDDQGLPVVLVPHVVPLLAWDPVAEDAVRALRKVAEEHVGQLTDALIDPNQPFAVRRRLARVFSVCVSQRAADGLLLGLDDLRFEVRFQCGRSLGAIREKNLRVRIEAARVFDVVRREVAVGRPVWQSHRLLDRVHDEEDRSFVDEFLRDRADQSLAHVFALLALVLPTAPLQIAYRGLHTSDANLRGTALEYLESVLPPDIRRRLWPFLGDAPSAVQAADSRAREEVLNDLLRSNESILMNLEELRRRAGAGV